ncbi:MAG: hypothetical protein D6767_06565, partial [Candidatus Hydrogenedentota bacterium]
LLYGDKKEVVPSVLKSTSLEYEITSRIYKMAFPGERKIAVATDVGNLKLSDDKDPFASLKFLNMGVEPLYGDIVNVDLNSEDVPADVTVLIVPATSGLSDWQRFRIDQYIMRGGNVFWLMGGEIVNFFNGMASPVSAETLEFYKHYGISVGLDLVMEPENFIPIQNRVNLFQIQRIPYPFWVVAVEGNIAQDHLITKDLEALFFPWASSMTFVPDSLKGIDVDDKTKAKPEKEKVFTKVLATSSKDAWLKTGTIFISPQTVVAELQNTASRVGVGKKNLAVYLEGKYKSFFLDHKKPDEKAEFIPESQKKSKIVAVSSPYFLSDSALQMSKLANLNFALAAFDVMHGLEDLVNARKKKISAPVITGELSPTKKNVLTLLNFLLPILFVAGYGIWRFKQRKELAKMVYPGLAKPNAEGGNAS